MRRCSKAGTHASSIGWERMGLQVNLTLPWRKTGEPQRGDGAFSNTSVSHLLHEALLGMRSVLFLTES